MKKTTTKWLVLLLAAVMIFSLSACSDDEQDDEDAEETVAANKYLDELTDSGGRRDYRVRGGNTQSATVMVFMCGSDLETDGGAATRDINEILYATLSDSVNIVIETGGSYEWQNSVIPSDSNTRWLVTEDGLEQIGDVGLRDMTDPDTLTDFITYCADEFPADRYILVLWDHGGGTLGGFAYDENFPNSEAMGIVEMNRALASANVVFDIIGFDACLMATAETAFMLDKYADYMIASQRVEPGNGWDYTPWISALCDNPAISAPELGQIIADGFVEHNRYGYYGSELTLSVLDLTYVRPLFDALYAFFSSAEEVMVEDRTFKEVSQARYNSRALTDNMDQVDIAYLAENMELDESALVLRELDNCIVYNAATIDNHNGLCLYFPYTDLSMVGEALYIYDEIGIGSGYQSFISSFSSLMLGGQAYSGGGSGAFGGSGFDFAWLDEDWVESDLIDDYSDYYDEYYYDSEELEITDKGDYFALCLTEESWDLITDIELAVFVSEGDWSFDLGTDNVYDFDDDGDLIVEFDYTWVALNGEIVPFYAEGETVNGAAWSSFGYVPCYINDVEAELVLIWNNHNPTGYVAGYRYTYDCSVGQKGLFSLKDGDLLETVCDYYDEYGYYDGLYVFTSFIIDGELEVSYEDIGDPDCEIYYMLYDIYGNVYWTESLYYE